MHAIRFFLAFVFCALAVPTVSAAPGDPVLVIAGASYSKDWKTPPLPGYRVVNTGKGGDETQQVLARFGEVLAARPAAVILWGHINNIHRAPEGQMEAAKERARANYREMVAIAKANGITPILATEVTLSEAVGFMNRLAAFVGGLRGKEGYNARINREVRGVNDWLRVFAREQNLKLLDFEKVLEGSDGFRDTDYTTDDGTHISEAGYVALTRYARDELTRR
jgi:lysophospholipase L1-like esterase